MSGYEHELAVGLEAVSCAARLSERVRHAASDGGAVMKADQSPVTLADFGVQAIVHRYLDRAYPADPIVAEEDTEMLSRPEHAGLLARLLDFLNDVDGPWTREEVLFHLGRGGHTGGAQGRFWTLDPVDGTKGFVRGDQYAIALALIETGRPVLGVLGCPHLAVGEGPDAQRGWIFGAVEGRAFARSLSGPAEEQPVRVSPVSNAAEIRMCESFEHQHSDHGISATIRRDLGIHREAVRMDSQAKYAAVAYGMAEAYLRLPTRSGYREKIWDHAAGVFLLEQAGGKVTDVLGQPLDFSLGRALENNRGIVATTGGVHAAVIAAVTPHFADQA